MKRIELNKNWKYCELTEADDYGQIPADAQSVGLPVDLLAGRPRNYNIPLGKYNGWYDSCAFAFYRVLPQLKRSSTLLLVLRGVNTLADVYLNGVYVGRVEHAPRAEIDITDAYVYATRNILKLVIAAPAETGRYTGAGIADGVELLTGDGEVLLERDGLWVHTEELADKAALTVRLTPRNRSESVKFVTAEAVVYNARGKKVVRKVRKLRLPAASSKEYSLPVKLTRHYDWSGADPYLYRCDVSLYDGDALLDSDSVSFGIRKAELGSRGFVCNGQSLKLYGAVMAHDNGLLGNASAFESEWYKLSRIKELGYNAVRYIGLPASAALDACDRLGLFAVVDLFAVWRQGNFPFDGHENFERDMFSETETRVRALRSHPCVIMYSLGDTLPECYGRGDGATIATMLAETVRLCDNTRPLTANARELVPLRQEVEAAGGRAAKLEGEWAQAAVSFGREKDLFRSLTSAFFAPLDVAGYSYLYPRYGTDRMASAKPIVGLATLPCRAFDAKDETDKYNHVVGDFKFTGADFLGEALGCPVIEDEPAKLLPPHASYCGDLDITYQKKVQGYYRQILSGNRSVSLITACDPESKQHISGSDHSVKQTRPVWNWPRYLGQPVEIEVLSGGEVVALYLNDKLIGRKLAGKINRHIATFKTEYYPGKLEAISYHKGKECSRCVLESVSAPRSVKLECACKTIDEGRLAYVEVSILDREGRLVPYAAREVEVSVTGEGEQVALGNGDPENQTTALSQTCPVYEGRALLVVRGTGEGKINVKVTSDGLLSAKITLKVRPTAE